VKLHLERKSKVEEFMQKLGNKMSVIQDILESPLEKNSQGYTVNNDASDSQSTGTKITDIGAKEEDDVVAQNERNQKRQTAARSVQRSARDQKILQDMTRRDQERKERKAKLEELKRAKSEAEKVS
jgi:hypothetical protein